jgi:pimeloyl-ACP methyl ester carboxylesterase
VTDTRIPTAPPARGRLVREWRTAVELPRLLGRAPSLARAPRGDGAPVLTIPGWRAPEASVAPITGYLRWLGYDARSWGLGVNRGFPERDAPIVAERIAEVARRADRPVTLVGWSLGGTIAREAARVAPESVRRVITYGTPAVGGPSYTLGASTYGPQECARIAALIDRLDAESPIRVPITAIYTRRDSVVSWQACLDHRSPDVEHVEVRSTPLGLGIDPDVWHVVADRLAR